jgi:hypothetical protein
MQSDKREDIERVSEISAIGAPVKVPSVSYFECLPAKPSFISVYTWNHIKMPASKKNRDKQNPTHNKASKTNGKPIPYILLQALRGC